MPYWKHMGQRVSLSGSIILLRLCDQAAMSGTAASSFCLIGMLSDPEDFLLQTLSIAKSLEDSVTLFFGAWHSLAL